VLIWRRKLLSNQLSSIDLFSYELDEASKAADAIVNLAFNVGNYFTHPVYRLIHPLDIRIQDKQSS
jgi:hypothetical protein